MMLPRCATQKLWHLPLADVIMEGHMPLVTEHVVNIRQRRQSCVNCLFHKAHSRPSELVRISTAGQSTSVVNISDCVHIVVWEKFKAKNFSSLV